MNRGKNVDMVLAVCVFLAALAGPAGAVTYYVDPNDSADFTTIQAAIDAASDDDEIEVAPATYDEAIDFLGKAVKLYSREGRDVTIIDGMMAYHVVQCISGEDANTILAGFTITGGDASGFEPNEQCGGGMYNYNSSPTVVDCNFAYNWADANGGGMYNEGGSPTVTNCTFTSNWAGFMDPGKGGAMCNSGSNPTVTNCTFSDNDAFLGQGGGMYNDLYSSPTVTNCTFSGNQATSGGGIYNDYSSPMVTNCILWDDIPDEIYPYGKGSYNVNYSDLDVFSPIWGTGNINADPCFVDADAKDFRLLYDSPCIDAGDNNSVPADTADLDGDGNTVEPIPFDADGGARVVDGNDDGTAVVDMGAYEAEFHVHNITQDTWYGRIQAAIDDANDDDKIEVAPGTYNEAINFLGKAITLRSSNPNDPNIVAATVIDGTGNYHVVQCVTGEEPNTVLSGFTITGGNANGPEHDDQRGGGMYNYNSSPTINNCTFSGNTAISSMTLGVWVGGGGMCNEASSPTVTNCIFNENSIWVSVSNGWVCGGGMYNYNSSNPTVTGCTFTENTSTTTGAYSHGGGIGNRGNSSPTVTNCTFTNNSSVHWGGGMYNDEGCHSTVTNCTFSGNTSDTGGGGIGNYNSSPTVTNCTFSDNNSPDGGGMFNKMTSNPTVTNCILWGDAPDEIYGGSPTVNYSDVEGGWGGAGGNNINADPCFVDAGGGNLRLGLGSPCIDAADNNSVPGDTSDLDGDGNSVEPTPWDLDSRPRIVDGDCNDSNVVDMGAYEFGWAYIGDFDGECDVDFADWGLFAPAWLKEQGEAGYVPDYDISIPADNKIDWADVKVFCDNWLCGK